VLVDVCAALNVEPTVELAVRCAPDYASSWPNCNLVERGLDD
jgi:hypothetical protein